MSWPTIWSTSGATIAFAGLEPGTRAYDAALHALFLGFVFAMVFGHAPIIFPAVLPVKLPYHPVFYAPLALLHASLIVRLAGAAAGRFELTRLGGALNALALAVFVATMIVRALRGGAGKTG